MAAKRRRKRSGAKRRKSTRAKPKRTRHRKTRRTSVVALKRHIKGLERELESCKKTHSHMKSRLRTR